MSERLTVKDSPVGLFKLDCGEIICISEYASKTHNSDYSRDAYIVSSGENYCGGDDRYGEFLDVGELEEENQKLTEQLERLTECSYPEWCEPRSKKYKCQGCKNKALLEVEGE